MTPVVAFLRPASLLQPFVCLLVALAAAPAFADQCIVLLHGLARTPASMKKLEARLTEAGYRVANIGYPSREYPVEELAELAVGQGIAGCESAGASSIGFVTHSLGGILVRVYLQEHRRRDIGRVVMLGPPNQGSEVVDRLKHAPGFGLFNGPAGQQLGTGPADLPKALGPVGFELGVIAGTQSINWLLSLFLPNPDDGKVSVAATQVEGMKDFVTVPVSHPFLMQDEAAIEQVLYFLENGVFRK